MILLAQASDGGETFARLVNQLELLVGLILVTITIGLANIVLTYLNRMISKILGTKMDGNTTLCATHLVSSGTLPVAAPCIPAVAKALSETQADCQSSITYADTAISKARETMEKSNIPIQSQDLLIKRLVKEIADLIATEARHNANNVENSKVWAAEVERLKAKVAGIEHKTST